MDLCFAIFRMRTVLRLFTFNVLQRCFIAIWPLCSEYSQSCSLDNKFGIVGKSDIVQWIGHDYINVVFTIFQDLMFLRPAQAKSFSMDPPPPINLCIIVYLQKWPALHLVILLWSWRRQHLLADTSSFGADGDSACSLTHPALKQTATTSARWHI